MASLRIGSRGSALALWQAGYIRQLLLARGHNAEIMVIVTTGDKILDQAGGRVANKGVFTKEIEEALADDRVDLAVHSLKDLPTELASRFAIAAIPEREDARDVLCSARYGSIAELPSGASVGTSSLRREAQLRALRPDLAIRPLRGNVDTRLRKMEAGAYDAIVLAAAGLKRLGREQSIRQFLPVELMCPAAGQGALAIEIRAGDSATAGELEFLDHPQARATTDCERALLDRMGGGCQVPIGAYAEWCDQRVRLTGMIAHPGSGRILRAHSEGEDPIRVGRELGGSLLEAGGKQILEELAGQPAGKPQWP